MIVFGGTSVVDFTTQTFTTLGDLWELSNANGLGGTPTWTELAQFGTPPGPRVYHAAAFDSANQRMILLGGRNDADTPPTSNRVWVLTPPNQPPVANAGPDQTVECTSSAGTSVTLDGSGSSDPDNDPLDYTWTGPFPEGGGTVTGVGPTVTLAQGGPYTITLSVDDGNAGTHSDTVDVC
jgi:hypothetical protein